MNKNKNRNIPFIDAGVGLLLFLQRTEIEQQTAAE